MHMPRAILRLFAFVFITAYFVTLIVVDTALSPRDAEIVPNYFRRWARSILRALGIAVRVSGQVPLEPALILPNHRSYIDVAFFQAWIRCCYVAKAEVRKWPLIGYGADKVHTLWVDRSSKDSRRETREKIRERLRQGHSVVVFPEGTTYKAPELGKFHPGMFYAAADGSIPVVPVAIEYRHADDAWIGADTFIPHFLKTFGKRRTEVRIAFGPRLTGTDGEVLLEKTRNWIADELAHLHAGWQTPEAAETTPLQGAVVR